MPTVPDNQISEPVEDLADEQANLPNGTTSSVPPSPSPPAPEEQQSEASPEVPPTSPPPPIEEPPAAVTPDVLTVESDPEEVVVERILPDEDVEVAEDVEPVPQKEEEEEEEEVEEIEPQPVDQVGEEIGVIEGVVDGENEIETLNNDENSVADGDVADMVESGNMEQLASVVLSGDGDRLVGQRSDNPEIQAFLDNVPIYMVKYNITRSLSFNRNVVINDRCRILKPNAPPLVNHHSPSNLLQLFNDG